MMDFAWEKFPLLLIASSIVGFLIRLILNKSLHGLEQIAEKVAMIDKRLAAIDIHVQELGKIREIVMSHDRKIVELETTMRSRNGSAHLYSSSRFDHLSKD